MSTVHVDYPHEPGTLYDCPACEEQCYCNNGTCVHCAEVAAGWGDFMEATYDPDTHPWDRIEDMEGIA